MRKERAEEPLVFDDVERPNDLQGTLQASVRWAQSQIMPAHIAPGDIQPHLTARRRTLLMVKPLDNGAAPVESLNVQVMDREGNLLGSRDMSPPPALPKTAYHLDVVPDDADMTPPEGPAYLIQTQDELIRLDDPEGAYLLEKLREHARVLIHTMNGAWVRDIYLPDAPGIEGKTVEFASLAGYHSIVRYSGRETILSNGMELLFKRFPGTWVSDDEADNQRLVYATGTWSVELPAGWIAPGMSMRFESGDLNGELADIHVGGTTQLLMHTIDIGMLVTPRDAYPFANDPTAHREYFQTIPVTQLVVSQYQSIHLTEVMLPDGTLLVDFDPSEGGWHTGTMRERTGKEAISRGINEANYGIHSAPGMGESTPFLAAQLTAHNSRGRYVNGVQVHGGSGGAGVVTLDKSLGNELSHEVGHNYGLGHYVGGFDGSVHRPAGEINSTWCWDAAANLFIPNFESRRSGEDACLDDRCQPPFHDRSFGFDTMAGGAPMSGKNRLTLHTPHTAAIVQRFCESKAVFAVDSPTLFRRWNPVAMEMEPYDHRIGTEERIRADNGDLSEATFATLLDRYDVVSVYMEDGDWTRDIHVPLASPSNAKRVIAIVNDATLTTFLHLNGSSIPAPRGFRANYVSNGTIWTECILLTADMMRGTVPNEDLSMATLARWLAARDVLHIAMTDGDWSSSINVPPASQANAHRVITVRNDAFLQTQLRINGLSIPVYRGDSRNYISDGGSWRERPSVVDLSVARRPVAFGVPVTTLVGYYDPEGTLPSYIFPALHGAFGFLYPDDGESVALNDCQLWVQDDNGIRKFRLSNHRGMADLMNRFSVNLGESTSARRAFLLRNGQVVADRTIDPATDTLTYTVNGDTQLIQP